MTLPVLLDGRKVNEVRLDELLGTLGLTERRNNLPNQLSGGQKQRVSIGRTLMDAPGVVLADEPTGNLDSKNTQEIMQLLCASTSSTTRRSSSSPTTRTSRCRPTASLPSRTAVSPATSASGRHGA